MATIILKTKKRTERVRIVFADELPDCPCCGEKWCLTHEQHYADCPCVGPHNAEDLGYKLVTVRGIMYGVRPLRSKS